MKTCNSFPWEKYSIVYYGYLKNVMFFVGAPLSVQDKDPQQIALYK